MIINTRTPIIADKTSLHEHCLHSSVAMEKKWKSLYKLDYLYVNSDRNVCFFTILIPRHWGIILMSNSETPLLKLQWKHVLCYGKFNKNWWETRIHHNFVINLFDDDITIELMFAGVNMFLALLRLILALHNKSKLVNKTKSISMFETKIE